VLEAAYLYRSIQLYHFVVLMFDFFLCDVLFTEKMLLTVSSSLLMYAGNTYIMVPPQNTTALDGSRVKLSCQAEAFPNNVTYEWLHDGNVVPASSRTTVYADGSLVFASVDVDDAGWYTCRPTNGLGLTPEARAYLNVTCKSRVTLNKSQRERAAKAHKSIYRTITLLPHNGILSPDPSCPSVSFLVYFLLLFLSDSVR